MKFPLNLNYDGKIVREMGPCYDFGLLFSVCLFFIQIQHMMILCETWRPMKGERMRAHLD